MLAWQLLSLAGVVPSANAFHIKMGIDPFWIQVKETTNLSISFCKSWITPQILRLPVKEDTPIELPKTIWKELENYFICIL